MIWFRFFLGTPQRLLATLFAILVVAMMFDPAIGTSIVNAMFRAAAPFVVLGFVAFVIIGIVRGRF